MTKTEFAPYAELHILTDAEGTVREVDFYKHEAEDQGSDNFIKTYKTLNGARKAAERTGLQVKEHEEVYF